MLTQVELGAVSLDNWALVYVSCLLMAIGFQRGTHNQPVKRKRRSQVVGEAGLGGRGGGEEDGLIWRSSPGSWDLVPGVGIQR